MTIAEYIEQTYGIELLPYQKSMLEYFDKQPEPIIHIPARTKVDYEALYLIREILFRKEYNEKINETIE